MKSKLFMLFMVVLLATALVIGCAPADDAVDDDVDDVDEPVGIETYTIVGLFPFTGPLSTFAENNAEAAKLAAEDVNKWLEEEGKNWRLRFETDDTQTEGPVALRKMQSWYGEGVLFFAGPMASGATAECLAFANANEILYISPSSTSAALGIAGDWLYRFCTDDGIQAPALRSLYEASGATHVIYSWRGDTWGDGLQGAAEKLAIEAGIEVYPEKLSYDPLKEDFTTDVALLDQYVTDLVGQGVALENIAFNLIAFEEASAFMAEAAGYEQLWDIIWIGSDGTAVSQAIKAHPVASELAAHVKFINSMNEPSVMGDQSKRDYVRESIQDILGRETDSYSYNSHDIIWAFALALNEVGYDTAAVREVLPGLVDGWSQEFGASGHIVLNEFGDRAVANYDLWLLRDDLEWEVVGVYRVDDDAITWYEEIY